MIFQGKKYPIDYMFILADCLVFSGEMFGPKPANPPHFPPTVFNTRRHTHPKHNRGRYIPETDCHLRSTETADVFCVSASLP